MRPFEASIDLSKYVNGLYVWGDFSYLEYGSEERRSVILLEVDFDGVQHFCTTWAQDYNFVAENFNATRR